MINLLRWIARIGGLCALLLGLMLTRLAPAALQTHMVLGSLVAVTLAILVSRELMKRSLRYLGAGSRRAMVSVQLPGPKQRCTGWMVNGE